MIEQGEIGPSLAVIIGLGTVAIGLCATLALRHWPPHPSKQANPLSGLFDRDTLDVQLSRVAGLRAREEHKDRKAFPVRAKVVAKRSARSSPLPHHAAHFDHAAVLEHIAKVMRAGLKKDERARTTPDLPVSVQWEEVILLPPPAEEDRGAKVA